MQQSERDKENTLEHLKVYLLINIPIDISRKLLLQSQIEQLKAEKINLENRVKEISKREDRRESELLKVSSIGKLC